MRAKKSLGQHFLKSASALTKIIETGKLKIGDLVLEIGPGQGALTERLLSAGARVIAVEKDKELFEFLKNRFAKEISKGQLVLVQDDILKFDIGETEICRSAGQTRWKLIANIPYNITGAILEKFLSIAHQPEKIVLVLQKEAAERIISRDGKESVLSIAVKAYGNPRYVGKIKAGSFIPAPRVDSAIIAIEKISKNFFDKINEQDFFKIVHLGFIHKRKRLFSNLSRKYGREIVSRVFATLGLDENVRAEDIDILTWQKIAVGLTKEESG